MIHANATLMQLRYTTVNSAESLRIGQPMEAHKLTHQAHPPMDTFGSQDGFSVTRQFKTVYTACCAVD